MYGRAPTLWEGIRLEGGVHLGFEIRVGDDGGGPGDGYQGGQIGAVALGQQLFGQEGHDGGDGAV